MNKEYAFFAAEISQLNALLAIIPAEDVIDRMSLSARLESAKEALQKIPMNASTKAKLTFRGKPILRSEGISADFAAQALRGFTDAFSTVASSLQENLKNIGPIPDKNRNRLMITSTAIGSFGFELELPSHDSLGLGMSQASDVVLEKVESLMRLSSTIGTDDELTELVDEIHPRAVKKLHGFLKVLEQHEALCSLEFNNKLFRYNNADQLKYALDRLNPNNIKECEEILSGSFEGALPSNRTFEFKKTDGDIIKGKISLLIETPNKILTHWLDKPVTTKFQMIRVGGGHPRYELVSLDDIRIQPT